MDQIDRSPRVVTGLLAYLEYRQLAFPHAALISPCFTQVEIEKSFTDTEETEIEARSLQTERHSAVN